MKKNSNMLPTMNHQAAQHKSIYYEADRSRAALEFSPTSKLTLAVTSMPAAAKKNSAFSARRPPVL